MKAGTLRRWPKIVGRGRLRSRVIERVDNVGLSMGHRQQPPTVPKHYAGQWIAWNRRHTKIIASGRTFAETRERAIAAGESDPWLAKVPKTDVRFVGGSR